MGQSAGQTTSNQYCDSNLLERNWFDWVLARATPTLELFRVQGLLWTRVGNTETNLPNPYQDRKEHCVAFPVPLFGGSAIGEVDASWGTATGRSLTTGQAHMLLSLELDDPLLCLDMPYLQQGMVIPALRRGGYTLEQPAMTSWLSMIDQIARICSGVAKRFRPPTEEEREELSQEALLQVMRKLDSGVLRYMPGRAPVFNLFTTTIYHCMYTIKTKSSKQRENSSRFAARLAAGTLPQNLRSLRIPV